MELSLDEIITQNRKTGRGGGRGRGGARGGRGGRGGGARTGRGAGRSTSGGRFTRGRGGGSFGRSSRAPAGQWTHDKFKEDGFGRRAGVGGGPRASGKICINNLDFGVTDNDIMELFSEIGQIKFASVHYDRSGRSMGKADVLFDRRTDAAAAMQQYNGVPLDGRAMQITWATPIVAKASPSPTRTLRQVQGGRVERRGGARTGAGKGTFRRGGRGAGAGGGRGRGGRGGKKAAPTAAELDAELDAYVKQNPK